MVSLRLRFLYLLAEGFPEGKGRRKMQRLAGTVPPGGAGSLQGQGPLPRPPTAEPVKYWPRVAELGGEPALLGWRQGLTLLCRESLVSEWRPV